MNKTLNERAKNVLAGNAEEVNNFEDVKNLVLEIREVYEEEHPLSNLFEDGEFDEFLEEIENSRSGITRQPRHISFINTEFGMLLNVTMETSEDTEPYKLNDPNGTFGYVWNVHDNWCSEWGYSFYENNRRVG